ncbi:MAG: hypothetical protein H7Y09_11125 [Chitinophagaceae bacterium]|nr:hypothetical protein [Anaerolineae bacterium]
MIRFPRRNRKTRWIIILYGVGVFFWLGLEDNNVIGATLIGLVGSGLGVFLWIQERFDKYELPARYVPILTAMMGCVIGAATSLLTAGLMLFKNARHAHLFPDYPAGLMGAILSRAPTWMIVGAFWGIGIGLLWLAFAKRDNN